MNVEAYLFFEGRCEEALEFYRKNLGAEVLALVRFQDHPERDQDPTHQARPGEKIMHALFQVGETKIMASDGMCEGNARFEGFALTVNVADEAEAARVFGALAGGGDVLMPLTPTFYSPSFGMVKDRFGVMWMVLTAKDE